MGTPWVRKSAGLGQISAYRRGRYERNNFFQFSILFVRRRSEKFGVFFPFGPFPKLSVEGSIPFARSNVYENQVLRVLRCQRTLPADTSRSTPAGKTGAAEAQPCFGAEDGPGAHLAQARVNGDPSFFAWARNIS